MAWLVFGKIGEAGAYLTGDEKEPEESEWVEIPGGEGCLLDGLDAEPQLGGMTFCCAWRELGEHGVISTAFSCVC